MFLEIGEIQTTAYTERPIFVTCFHHKNRPVILNFPLEHPGSAEMEESRSAFVVIEYCCSIEQYPSGWELNPVGHFMNISQVFASPQ